MPKTRGNKTNQKAAASKRKVEELEVSLAKKKPVLKKLKLEKIPEEPSVLTPPSSVSITPLIVDIPGLAPMSTPPPPHIPPIGYFGGIVKYEQPEEETDGYGGIVPYSEPVRGTNFKVSVLTDETASRIIQIRQFEGDFPTEKYITMKLTQYAALTDFLKNSKDPVINAVKLGNNPNYKYVSHLGRGLFLQVGFPYWVISLRHFFQKKVYDVQDEGYSSIITLPTKQGVSIKFKSINELLYVFALIENKFPDIRNANPCILSHSNPLDMYECTECNWSDPQ